MISRRTLIRFAAGAPLAGLGIGSSRVWAQSYPTRTIKVIVPFPPAGPSDSITRIIAEQLRVALNQTVVVENRPGAGGNIGLGEAARATPDGYTLALIATSTFSVNPFVYSKIPYDPERDFVPVAVFARVANILFVTPSLPAASLGDLVALAKARPGKLNAGFPGSGNSSQIALALLRKQAGLDITGVAYPGDAPALVALMSGEIDMLFSVSQQATQLVDSKKVRALAVASPVRAPSLPDVPTFAEAGMKDFFDTTAFFGFATNAAVPHEIMSTLNTAINRITATPEFNAKLAQFGMTPGGGTLDEIEAFTAAERARWEIAVRESGAKVE